MTFESSFAKGEEHGYREGYQDGFPDGYRDGLAEQGHDTDTDPEADSEMVELNKLEAEEQQLREEEQAFEEGTNNQFWEGYQDGYEDGYESTNPDWQNR